MQDHAARVAARARGRRYRRAVEAKPRAEPRPAGSSDGSAGRTSRSVRPPRRQSPPRSKTGAEPGGGGGGGGGGCSGLMGGRFGSGVFRAATGGRGGSRDRLSCGRWGVGRVGPWCRLRGGVAGCWGGGGGGSRWLGGGGGGGGGGVFTPHYRGPADRLRDRTAGTSVLYDGDRPNSVLSCQLTGRRWLDPTRALTSQQIERRVDGSSVSRSHAR